jgi:hypothetical protein
MTEQRGYIDIMAAPMAQRSRWDHGDGAGTVRTLDDAMAKAGLPGQLEVPLRLLARAEELAEAARAAKAAAGHQLEAADQALYADGPIDAAAYGRIRVEVDPWLLGEAAAMQGMMAAVHRVQGNATATTFAMADSLYAKLQAVCREVVGEIAAVPPLPREGWSATTTGQASTLAIRANRELEWARLVKARDQFDAVHSAAALLRETGQFQAQLNFPGGCRTEVGIRYLNWEAAEEGLRQVDRLPVPLRVRAAHDQGWKPGLWLRRDHEAAAAEAKPKRGILGALAGR